MQKSLLQEILEDNNYETFCHKVDGKECLGVLVDLQLGPFIAMIVTESIARDIGDRIAECFKVLRQESVKQLEEVCTLFYFPGIVFVEDFDFKLNKEI
mgnify:CR=1 FL=1